MPPQYYHRHEQPYEQHEQTMKEQRLSHKNRMHQRFGDLPGNSVPENSASKDKYEHSESEYSSQEHSQLNESQGLGCLEQWCCCEHWSRHQCQKTVLIIILVVIVLILGLVMGLALGRNDGAEEVNQAYNEQLTREILHEDRQVGVLSRQPESMVRRIEEQDHQSSAAHSHMSRQGHFFPTLFTKRRRFQSEQPM